MVQTDMFAVPVHPLPDLRFMRCDEITDLLRRHEHNIIKSSKAGVFIGVTVPLDLALSERARLVDELKSTGLAPRKVIGPKSKMGIANELRIIFEMRISGRALDELSEKHAEAFAGHMALPAPMTGGEPWYSVMNINPNSTMDEITKRYRSMAKQYHSDTGGDGDKMSALNVAYDEAKKAQSQ